LWNIQCPSHGIDAHGMVGSGNHSKPQRHVFALAKGPIKNPNGTHGIQVEGEDLNGCAASIRETGIVPDMNLRTDICW
jgi:hypothetical protein